MLSHGSKFIRAKGLQREVLPPLSPTTGFPPKSVTVVHLYSYTLCIVSCCSGLKSFLTPWPHGLQHARLLCPVYKQLSLCILPLFYNGSMLYVLCTSCYSTLTCLGRFSIWYIKSVTIFMAFRLFLVFSSSVSNQSCILMFPSLFHMMAHVLRQLPLEGSCYPSP